MTKLTRAFGARLPVKIGEERACKLSDGGHKTAAGLFPLNGTIRLKARLFGGCFTRTPDVYPSLALLYRETLAGIRHLILEPFNRTPKGPLADSDEGSHRYKMY